MTISRVMKAATVMFLAMLTCILPAIPSFAGINVWVSAANDGSQGNDAHFARVWPLSISGDGNLIVFASKATNLVANDTNNTPDLFLRDISNETTHRISVSSTEEESIAVTGHWDPTLSDDARFVTFISDSTNLTDDGPYSSGTGLFVKDLNSGTVKQIIRNPDTGKVSGDGNYVYYLDGYRYMHMYDTNLGTSIPILSGVKSTRYSCVSSDGQYVGVVTDASLVAEDTNGRWDIYRYDVVNDTLVLAKREFEDPNDISSGITSSCQLSNDGRYIVFPTYDSFVVEDVNSIMDLYSYDFQESKADLISTHPEGGLRSWGEIAGLDMNGDGSLIAYSRFPDADESNPANQIWLYDRLKEETTIISLDEDSNEGNGWSVNPVISEDGVVVAFQCIATNILPDNLPNRQTEIMARILIHDIDADGYMSDVDCDDYDPNIYPDASEVPYNGIDENCNGLVDDDDLDQDSYGVSVDCNEGDSSINPGAVEVPYNGIDENCNGMVDDDDVDNDGFSVAVDCNDTDVAINPASTEVPYNGIDENCNGMDDDDDLDTDGYGYATDCNENDPSINPGVVEMPYNGIDENCNGMLDDDDLDQDGYLKAQDCNDNDAAVNPGEAETPYNGVDDNCNGMSDDDDLDLDGYLDAQDCNDNDADINPLATEVIYNGVDENCNGMADDDDLDQDGYDHLADCDESDAAINPGATEFKFDGIDQDCNGYDLTITIGKAIYDSKKDVLSVEATSNHDFTDGSVLTLVSFGAMATNGNKWSLNVDPAGGDPVTVTVSGVEGEETLAVSVK